MDLLVENQLNAIFLALKKMSILEQLQFFIKPSRLEISSFSNQRVNLRVLASKNVRVYQQQSGSKIKYHRKKSYSKLFRICTHNGEEKQKLSSNYPWQNGRGNKKVTLCKKYSSKHPSCSMVCNVLVECNQRNGVDQPLNSYESFFQHMSIIRTGSYIFGMHSR